jgi:undecaprenyl-diphosphatase
MTSPPVAAAPGATGRAAGWAATRAGRRHPALAPVAVAVAGIAALTAVGFVLGWAITGLDDAPGWLERLDADAATWFADRRTSARTTFFEAASGLTDPGTVIGFGAGAACLLVVLRRWHPLVVLVAGLAVELLGYVAIAAAVGRTRPPTALGSEITSSFPSGHVAVAIVLYGGMAVVVDLLAPRTDARWPFRALVVVVVALVSVARLYLGLHYVSDVVVGWLFGAACLAVAVVAGEAWAVAARREASPADGDGVPPQASSGTGTGTSDGSGGSDGASPAAASSPASAGAGASSPRHQV